MKAALIGVALAVAVAPGARCAGVGEAPAQFDEMIARHAKANGVPERLVRRIIVRESRYNPKARHGNYYGMMQIMPGTARTMGYSGEAGGLLDADTNLAYGVRYLAGAYKVAGGNEDRAVSLYASGFYYDAKRKGMLDAVGLGKNSRFAPVPAAEPSVAPEVRVATASPAAPSIQRVATAFSAVTPAQPSVIPAPEPRDPPRTEVAQSDQPAPRSFLFARPAPQPAPAAEPAPSVVASAGPVIPLPPVRDLPEVVTGTVKRPQAAPALASVAKPVAAAQVAAAGAPSPGVALSAAKTPTPPVKPTAPVAARSASAVASNAPAQRAIAPTAAPVMASAGPLPPSRPREPSAAEPALSFAGSPRPVAEGVPTPTARGEYGSGLGLRSGR